MTNSQIRRLRGDDLGIRAEIATKNRLSRSDRAELLAELTQKESIVSRMPAEEPDRDEFWQVTQRKMQQGNDEQSEEDSSVPEE